MNKSRFVKGDPRLMGDNNPSKRKDIKDKISAKQKLVDHWWCRGKKQKQETIDKRVATRRAKDNYKVTEVTKDLISRNTSLAMQRSDVIEKLHKKKTKTKKFFDYHNSLKGGTRNEASSKKWKKWVLEHPEHFEKMRSNIKQTNVSSIEYPVRYVVEDLKLNYIPQFRIPVGNSYTRVDIFVPLLRLCIFVDGDYWHSLPSYIERDIRVNKSLKNDGYLVLRLQENEIVSNISIIKEKIQEYDYRK
jgi:very-short-patch-repair endonuclease